MKKQKIVSFFIGFLSLILLWQLLTFITENRAVPAPLGTFQRAWLMKTDLLLHAGASVLRIGAALVFSLIIGLPLGILLSRSKWIACLFGPLIYFLYPLPKVAFLPVFMIFFGLGNLSKILLIVAIISIQVTVSIRDSVNNIPKNYYRVMSNYNSSRLQTVRFLILPALLPGLLASLRVSTGISLASLFFAENYNTVYGLGYLILSAWSKMDYEEMFAGILMIGLAGYLIFSLFDTLEKRFCNYK
ncbi:ABC transporter permease subunit [Enterococcus sp. BWB1-3]|uniref:ABC transporter permease n=1 Tax=Enterococcus sp. BWB1-3 TaxID=2787713 RepID=UPI0019213C25|nr:ABC transporter permease subunit [Enterococcus sp. BWB1-3]MBL1229113.1 ABC transporter permease subunit [Enterococcus sp. BWB1-3]